MLAILGVVAANDLLHRAQANPGARKLFCFMQSLYAPKSTAVKTVLLF